MIRWLFVLCFAFSTACGSAQRYESEPYGQVIATSSGSAPMPMADSEADEGFFARKKSADVANERSTGGVSPEQAPISIDQKLIKNASLTVRLKDEKYFEEAVQRTEKVARGLDGYVANTSRTSITFKVPSGRLDEALAAVGELGKVIHRNVTAMDVTARYVDLGIRIENLQKLRVRLQELVAQGANVDEILHVEKELARVTVELEALEGQMRLLKNQTTFATVTVSFVERVRPGPVGWVFYGLYHGVKWLFVWD